MKGDVKHICRYCNRPFFASRESAAENPWCRHCLNERLAVVGIVSWLRDGADDDEWEEPTMHIYRDLANRIERREWATTRKAAARQMCEITRKAADDES
jgi:hypothetical protein